MGDLSAASWLQGSVLPLLGSLQPWSVLVVWLEHTVVLLSTISLPNHSTRGPLSLLGAASSHAHAHHSM